MTHDALATEARKPSGRRLLAATVSLLLVAGSATAPSASAAPESAVRFRTLHSFAFGPDRDTGGARPRPLMQASDGNFYGMSYAGGRRNSGTIYRMKPGANTVTVHSFRASEGYAPEGSLIQASDGHLYGVTSSGGTGASPAGTVFRFEAGGVLTTLHTFQGADGADPGAGLVQASDGNLYGTTSSGGHGGNGTVYRIALDGSFTVMHHFGAIANDGARPLAPLMQTRDGRLCGTTYVGGRRGGGIVFCMSLEGQMSVVHAFGSKPGDAGGSTSPLVEGDDGSLYGTSNFGGSLDQGALFRLKPDGRITVKDMWARPSGGLMKASDGFWYGTAYYGGSSDKGWIYRVTPTFKVTEVHSFSGPDGANPDGELVEGADGRLYGVTGSGGSTDAGVLFGIARRQAR